MHTLIVTSHPETHTYTHAVIEKVIAGLEKSPGQTYEVLDVAKTGFDPQFNDADYRVFREEAAPSADVLAEQARIDKADTLVLVFPVYWWSMPAALKGWVDRVFTQGWAYVDLDGESTTRLLGRLTVQILAIGGAVQGTYERRGYAAAMKTQIEDGIFGYVGAKVIGSELLLPLDKQSAAEGLVRAFEIGSGLTEAVGQARDAA